MSQASGMNGRKFKILIVDDQPMMRWAIRKRFAAETDLEVLDEASGVMEAMRHVDAQQPDLVITDTTLNGRCGIELIKELRSRFPEVKTLVHSRQPESVYAERAIRAGALGFVSKKESPDVLLGAVRSVLSGETALSKRMTDRFVKRAVNPGETNASGVACLSDRELEVLMLLGEGLAGPEIADRLTISSKTVDTHKRNIKAKLGLRNTAALMRFAVIWVDSGSPEFLPEQKRASRRLLDRSLVESPSERHAPMAVA